MSGVATDTDGDADRVPTRHDDGGSGLMVAGVGVAAAITTLVVFAVVRHLSAPGHPILPGSWCRVGAAGSLPPLLGPALLTRWLIDPVALVMLAVVSIWYAGAVRRVRRRGYAWPVARSVAFAGGIVVCGLATNSSIAVYDMALFSAHMVGHLMLVMLAPILLCAGRPLELLVAATAEPRRAWLLRRLDGPVASLVFCPPVALACYATVIVGSHLTGLMDTIMIHPWAGQVEHLIYVLIGCQFFTLVVGDAPIRWRLTVPGRWILLALSMTVDTFTGVILLMSIRPITLTMVPGLSVDALADTRTGGAIMWVGGDGLMAVVMIALVFTWLRRPPPVGTEAPSWVEAARRTTFEHHTGAPAAAINDADFDIDEANRENYNQWLAQLGRRQTGANP